MPILDNDEKAYCVSVAKQALHDSIVHVPGGSLFLVNGLIVEQFGVNKAANLLGKSHDTIRNMADPSKHGHHLSADDLHLLLLAGAPTIWLDEVERSLGRVAIQLPDIGEHGDLSKDLMKAIAEFGDIGKVMGEVLKDGKITEKEMGRFDRETVEAITALMELRETLRAKVVVR